MGIFDELIEEYTYNGVVSLKAIEDDILTLENQIDSYNATLEEVRIRRKNATPLINKIREAKIRLSCLKALYKKESDKETSDDTILNMLGISGKWAKEIETPSMAVKGRKPLPQNFASAEVEILTEEDTDNGVVPEKIQDNVNEIKIVDTEKNIQEPDFIIKEDTAGGIDDVVVEEIKIQKEKNEDVNAGTAVEVNKECTVEPPVTEEEIINDEADALVQEWRGEADNRDFTVPEPINEENINVTDLELMRGGVETFKNEKEYRTISNQEEVPWKDNEIRTVEEMKTEDVNISTPEPTDWKENETRTYESEPEMEGQHTLSHPELENATDKELKYEAMEQEELQTDRNVVSIEVDGHADNPTYSVNNTDPENEWGFSSVPWENSHDISDPMAYTLPAERRNRIYGSVDLHEFIDRPGPKDFDYFELDFDRKTVAVGFSEIADYCIMTDLLKKMPKKGLFARLFSKKGKRVFITVNTEVDGVMTDYDYVFSGCSVKSLSGCAFLPEALADEAHHWVVWFKYDDVEIKNRE